MPITPRVEEIIRKAKELLDEDETRISLEDNAEYQLRMYLSPARYIRLKELGFEIPKS